MEDFDRKIGHVYAGSGFRVETLDWCLVDIHIKVECSATINLLDINTSAKARTTMTDQIFCNRWSIFNVSRNTVRIAKMGRKSGWTFGTIGSELIRIDSKVSVGQFADIAEKHGLTTSSPEYCWQVVPSRKHCTFIEGGDSGSVLLHDPSGTWLGLCFGQIGAGNGLVMAIDRVFEDIKIITGTEVKSPVVISKLCSRCY